MMELESFFSLEHFEHRSLWQSKEPVWSALLVLQEYLSGKKNFEIEIELPLGIYLQHKEQISIGSGTVIEPSTLIQGPCVIGKNCRIRHGAYLRGPLILGDDCQVGHSAELKHAILLNGAAATHFVYVGDSILGNFANLGAGVKCANLRIDRRTIGKTGLKKLGAIIGDRVQIGCNSVLNPGTFIGKESFSHPLMSLKGVIPVRSQIDSKGIHPIEQKLLEKLLWQSSSSALK